MLALNSLGPMSAYWQAYVDSLLLWWKFKASMLNGNCMVQYSLISIVDINIFY